MRQEDVFGLRPADEYWYNNKFRYDNVMWQSPLNTENFGIAQIGEIYCRENISPPEHYQLFYELTFAVSGRGQCSTDGVTTVLTPQTVYLSRPEEYHKITSDRQDSLRFLCIAFVPKSPRMQALVDTVFAHYGDKDNRLVDGVESLPCMRAILDAFWRGNAYYDSLVDIELQKILYFLARTIPSTQPRQEGLARSATAFQLVSYIDIHFLNIPCVQSLAEEFGYDYQYLTKLFKKTFGLTVGQYITDKKLEYAKLLLTKQGRSVAETAELLGYSLPNNFTRAFKNKFGQTPREYCSLYKENMV